MRNGDSGSRMMNGCKPSAREVKRARIGRAGGVARTSSWGIQLRARGHERGLESSKKVHGHKPATATAGVTSNSAINAAASAAGAVGHAYGSRIKGRARTRAGECKREPGEHERWPGGRVSGNEAPAGRFQHKQAKTSAGGQVRARTRSVVDNDISFDFFLYFCTK